MLQRNALTISAGFSLNQGNAFVQGMQHIVTWQQPFKKDGKTREGDTFSKKRFFAFQNYGQM